MQTSPGGASAPIRLIKNKRSTQRKVPGPLDTCVYKVGGCHVKESLENITREEYFPESRDISLELPGKTPPLFMQCYISKQFSEY